VIAAPPVALTVSPTRLVLAARESATIEVANRGSRPAVIVATPAGYAVSLRGRPSVIRARAFVVVRPHGVAVSPGATATLVVSPAAAKLEPGDHPALVLVSSRPARGGIGVGVRIGVVVLVRGAGRIVHRVVPLALRTHGDELELSLRNAGNVSERLTAPSIRVRLLPHGVAHVEPRELLPHSRGLLRLHTRVRAPVGAIVRVLGRTFRLKVAGRR
jgi:hypothetical protein